MRRKLTEVQPRRSDGAFTEIIKALRDRVRIVITSFRNEIILNRLTDANTVFISPAHLAQVDWNSFRRAMKTDTTAKFTQSSHHRDLSAENVPAVYEFTIGIHPRYKNGVPRWLKAVLSSGLLGLWRKWTTPRLKFHQRGEANDEVLWFPLSFSGSDLHYAFMLFAVRLPAASGAFVLKVAVSHVSHFLIHSKTNNRT